MSAPPPVPPRPAYYGSGSAAGDAPPPLPPLPANYAYDPVFDGPAPPHWEDPLAAPRPFRYDPGIPADMAQQLERQLSLAGHAQAPGYPSYAPPPPPPQDPYRLDSGGFAPPRSLPTPLPPTASGWNAPPSYPATPQPYGYPQSYAQPPPPPPAPPMAAGWQSPPPNQNQRQSFVLPPLGAPIDQSSLTHGSTLGHSRNSSGGSIQMPGFPGGGGFGATLGIPSTGLRSSTPALPQASQYAPAPLPAPSSFAPTGSNQDGMSTLEVARPTTQSLSEKAPPETADAETKVAWAKEVLALVERTHAASASKGSLIVDPALNKLVERAIKDILDAAALNPPVAGGLALFLRGQLAGSGSFPTFVPRNPKNAFADYDASAKIGYAQAWFSVAREYETVGDVERAKQCLERGIKGNVGSCYYRLGMAHLIGQLGLRADPNRGLSMLHRAAQLASLDVPQPAYVFALLFLGSFPSYSATPQQMAPFLPPGSTPQLEAKRYLERAAYFGNGAAQFKLGHAYEFGVAPFPPDPLLSVQYYSLAAQRGHPEADLALSKWFLCGSEGAFEKDEALAKTFAEKSAMRGEKEGEFAMGYYCEVGIGAPNKTKDLESARKWYTLAAEKGSAEAKKRLDALQAAQPVVLGREEHEQLKDANLVRRRTQARDEAWAAGRRAKQQQTFQGLPPLAEEVRKAHMPVEPAVPVAAPAAIISANPVQPQPQPQRRPGPESPLNTSFPLQSASELGPATPLSARPQPSNPPLHGGRVRIPIRLEDTGPVGGGSSSPHPSTMRPPAGPSAVGGKVTAGAFGKSRIPSGGASNSPAPAQAPAPVAETLTPPAPAPAPLPDSPKPKPAAAAGSVPPKKGPQTFQEMGFHSQKMDEKECVIM